MLDPFGCIVVGSDQTDGGRSRELLRTIPSPMSGDLVMAVETLKYPAVIGGMDHFLTKPAAMPFCQGLFSPVDCFFDNNISRVIFVSREVDNSSSGIS